MSAEHTPEPDVEVIDFWEHTDRDAHDEFYLTVVETTPGRIDFSIEPGQDYDTREQAEAYLHREHAEYGVGGHVYRCERVAGLSVAGDEPPEGDESEDPGDGRPAV